MATQENTSRRNFFKALPFFGVASLAAAATNAEASDMELDAAILEYQRACATAESAPNVDEQLDIAWVKEGDAAEALFKAQCHTRGDVRKKLRFMLGHPQMIDYLTNWDGAAVTVLKSIVGAV